MSGNFRADSLSLIDSMRTAINVADDDASKAQVQATVRAKINDFIALYRRKESVTALSSFTTMRTALNSLAGHYSSYPNRPIPEKLKNRLEQEFKQVELSLSRETAL
jgi:photosystem II Psb27 protein